MTVVYELWRHYYYPGERRYESKLLGLHASEEIAKSGFSIMIQEKFCRRENGNLEYHYDDLTYVIKASEVRETLSEWKEGVCRYCGTQYPTKTWQHRAGCKTKDELYEKAMVEK